MLRIIYKGITVFTMVFICLIVFFVFIQSIARWVGYPIQWAADCAQLLFAWVIFLGAALAFQEHRHIGVEFFEQKFPSNIRIYLSFIWAILITIFLAISIYYGIELCINNYLRRYNSLPISYSWMTLSVPVGSILMFISNINIFLIKVKQLKELR